jgi:hypothetical protein
MDCFVASLLAMTMGRLTHRDPGISNANEAAGRSLKIEAY